MKIEICLDTLLKIVKQENQQIVCTANPFR